MDPEHIGSIRYRALDAVLFCVMSEPVGRGVEREWERGGGPFNAKRRISSDVLPRRIVGHSSSWSKP